MKHEIPVEELGVRGPLMADPIAACVHCGFCLPSCPTYVTMGEEMDSPRGRIFLIKEVLEGKLEVELAQPYLDNCLGCQACETACPSGVRYGELITEFRGRVEPRRRRPVAERARRELALRTLPHGKRFRAAARAGAVARKLRAAVPRTVRPMVDLLPERLPPARPLPCRFAAQGERRARVALLAGCVQQQLDPEIGWAAGRVLARNGVEVIVPAGQGCCGSLAMHSGEAEGARRLARRNLAAFPEDVDAVITTAAGCGSGMKEYGALFLGEPEEAQAGALAGRTRDVADFLYALGLAEPPPALACPRRVAYQDACHLAHAQKVTAPPRRLLSAIEGLELLEPAEAGLCCGSAGIYSLERPEVAAELGERKARNLLATGAAILASGNIGCLTQLQSHLARLGHPIPALHTVQVLDRAYSRTL
ncbi:MAG: 4Fe-4S dicluster domain-containing protein [Actinobacteria bacterium]|nr:4Fe-4S dicluster domain-containing protein [Actinomycetota bacterium]